LRAGLGPYFLGLFLHPSFLARSDKARNSNGPAQNVPGSPF
jgi:hypothetical protein